MNMVALQAIVTAITVSLVYVASRLAGEIDAIDSWSGDAGTPTVGSPTMLPADF